ncbi:hypothetical protein FM107_14005 [Sphingobacterium sp. JB170]|nr:hypothetical protein FM107_14005 [Sphingobacterium sp. JB170]
MPFYFSVVSLLRFKGGIFISIDEQCEIKDNTIGFIILIINFI